MLGRSHIHIFDTVTCESSIVCQNGEDQAERFGSLLKSQPELQKQLEEL